MPTLNELIAQQSNINENSDQWDYDVESIDKSKVLSDPRVLADMRRLFEVEGGKFDSDEDMVNYWYRLQSGGDTNLLLAGRLLAEASNDDQEMKRIKSRLARVRQHMPGPGEEGHPGWWEWTRGYVGNALWDITNFGGIGLAAKGIRGAALAGKIAKGKTATSAIGKKRMAQVGALEAGISGGQEAALNTMGQLRDIEIGVQDEFDYGELGLATGFGVLIGGVIGGAISGGATWFVGTRALSNIQKLRSAGWRDEDIAQLGEQQFKEAWQQSLPAPHIERTVPGDTIGMFNDPSMFEDGVPSGRPLTEEEVENLDRAPHYGSDTMSEEELALGAGIEPTRSPDSGLDAEERLLAEQRRQVEEELVDLRLSAEGSGPESTLWDQIQEAATRLSNIRKLQNWKARILREQAEIDAMLASNDPKRIEIGRIRTIDNAKTRAEYETLLRRVALDPSELDQLDQTLDQPSFLQSAETSWGADNLNAGQVIDPAGPPKPPEQVGPPKPSEPEPSSDAAAIGARGEPLPDTAPTTDATPTADTAPTTGDTATTTADAEPAQTKGRPKKLKDTHRQYLLDNNIVTEQQLEKTRPQRLAYKLAQHAGLGVKRPDGSNKTTEEILAEFDEWKTKADEDAASVEANETPVGETAASSAPKSAEDALVALSTEMILANPDSFLDRTIVFNRIEQNGLPKDVQDAMKDQWLTIMNQEPKSHHFLEGLNDEDAKWINREVGKRWKQIEQNATPMLMANPAMKEMYGSVDGFLKAARVRLEQQVRADYLEGKIGPRKRKKSATQTAIDKVEGSLGPRTDEQKTSAEIIAENLRIAREAKAQRDLERAVPQEAAPDEGTKTTARLTSEAQERGIQGETEARAYADLTGTKSPIKFRATGTERLSDTKRVDTENVDARRQREEAIEDAKSRADKGDAQATEELLELQKMGERVFKPAFAKKGQEAWYDPTTGRVFSNRNNINVANKIAEDVDLGPKVTPDAAHNAAAERRRVTLAEAIKNIKAKIDRNALLTEKEAVAYPEMQDELARLEARLGPKQEKSPDKTPEQVDDAELIYDEDGLESAVTPDEAGATVVQTGRRQVTNEDGDVEILDSVARTPEEHTVAITRAFQDYQESGNPQTLQDAIKRINEEFALEGTSIAIPEPSVQPGVRKGDRVVAIVKRDSDLSERKSKRVISQNQIAAGKGYRDLLGNAKEEDWIVGSVPRGISASDPNFAKHFVPDTPDDAPAIAKIPEGQPGSDQTSIDTFAAQTFELFSTPKTGGRVVTGPFSDIYEKILQVGTKYSEYFDNAAYKDGRIVITGSNLDRVILDLGHGFPESKKGGFAKTIDEHRDRVTMLETMLEVRRQLAPNGIRRQDEDLTQATDRLVNNIFSESDEATKTVARSVLQKLSIAYKLSPSGAPGRAPIIQANQDGGFGFAHGKNTIEVGDLGNGYAPNAGRLIHEVGHWAWDNILTDADKIEYLQMFNRYYNEDGSLNLAALEGRTIDNALIRTNALEGPGEFFASQLERWATQNVYRNEIGNETFWVRMVNYMKAIFDRYMDGRRIDPEMERLFKKILPANEARAAALRGPTTRAGTRAGQAIMNRAWALDDIMERLEGSLEGEDIEQSLFVPVELMHYLYSIGGGADGKNPLNAVAPIKSEIARASRELKDALNIPEGINFDRSIEVLSDIDPSSMEFVRRTELVRRLLDEGIVAEQPNVPMRPIRDIVEDIRQRLAKKFYNTEGEHYRTDNMPPSVKKYAYKNANGDYRAPGRKGGGRGRKYAAAAKQREKRKERVAKDLEKAQNMVAKDNGAPPVNSPSLKTLSDDELLTLWEQHSTGKFGKQIANEYGARVAARPLPVDPVEIPNEVFEMNTKDLLVAGRDAWRAGDSGRLHQVLYEYGRRAHNKNNPDNKIQAVRSKHVIDIMTRELADTVGDEANDGIPASARANVREILTQFSNRNPARQVAERRIMYRLLALAGRTQPGPEHENLVTNGDIYRLADFTGAERPKPRHPDSVFTDFGDPEFQSLRRSIREIVVGLQGSNKVAKGRGHVKSITDTLGHVIHSGILSEEDVTAVMKAYRPISRTDDMLRQKQNYNATGQLAKFERRTYADEERDDALHWFAFDTARLLNNSGSQISDPHLVNIQDRTIEGLAYVLNGQIKSKELKAKFPMLDAFGDMFAPLRVGGKHPLLDTLGRRTAIPQEYSVEYVGQLLESMTPQRFDAVMSFVGRGIGRASDSSPVVFWHGTASGPIEATPEFKVNMSDSGSVWGPGFYVTYGENARKAATFYASGAVSSRSYEFRIRDALEKGALTDKEAEEMLGVALDLLDARNVIRHNNALLRRIEQEITYEDPSMTFEDLNKNSRIARSIRESKEYMRVAGDVERFAQDMLREHGIGDDPHMIPMVAHINHPVDFRDARSYDMNSPLIREIVELGSTMGVLDSFALRRIDANFSRPLNGSDTYKALVDAFHANQNSLGKRHAKELLAKFLKDELGYDGMTYTHGFVDHNGDETLFDGAVVWDQSQVKALTAKEFDGTSDVFSQHVIQPRADVVDGVTPNGILMSAHIADARARNNAMNFSAIGNSLEEGGTSPRLVDTMRNMLKGKKATDSDIREVRKVARGLQLRTNSSRIRAWGGNWFADWVAPVEGTGYYESHHIMLAGKIMPIIKRLNDATSGHNVKGAMKRWMSKSNPLSKNMTAEEEKIAKALRRAPGNKYEKSLTPAGRETLAMIRGMFADEINEMEKAGIITGRIENYFPQIWSTEKIRRNMDDFRRGMARYFVHEAQDRGETLSMPDALHRADGMTETLLLEDGINLPPAGGGSRDKVTDHIDYQRLIRLDQYPEMVDALEPFLENNLRDVLVKYLDGTTSRLLFHNKFGVKNHGFYAYKKVIQEGEEGIIDLLVSDSIKMRPIKGRVGGEAVVEHANFKHRVINAPYSAESRNDAAVAVRQAMDLYRNRGALAAKKYLDDLSEEPNPEWGKRVDAIVAAMKIVQEDPVIHSQELDHIEMMMNALQRKPIDGGSRFFEPQHNLSKKARNFTAVTLLGWTALTSTTDPVLPLIRSGSIKAWLRGMRDWAKNPNYRDMMRESGIAIENLVHERLVHQYGVDGSKLATSFFNATMLTPWTQMQREWAGLVGYNWFKAEQKNYFQYGKDSRRGKRAFRVLKSYGLEHLMKDGAYQLDTPNDIGSDDALKMSLIKFANQSIYAPNPNDIPMWGQTPIGAMVFQLKSFPMMMGRMVGGRNETTGIIQEFKAGNKTPLLYFAAIAPWFGAGSLAAKDYAQFRGGDTERESALRERSLNKSLDSIGLEELAETLGYDPRLHPDMDAWLGNYVEGFGHLGGLSLLGELMHSAAANADNGQYGVNRIMSALLGPSFSHTQGAIEVFQGAHSMIRGDEAPGKRRAAARQVASRIPILGGIRAFREGVVDSVAGEATARKSKSSGSWGSGWGSSW